MVSVEQMQMLEQQQFEDQRRELQAEIDDYTSEYVGRSLKDFDLSGALKGLVEILRRFRILLPPVSYLS